MTSVDTDRNLLFAVLALQGELIDAGQLAEACIAWSAHKERPLADHLAERGWITAEQRRLIEQLLESRLKKHAGDAHQSLVAAASGAAGLLATLNDLRGAVEDDEIRLSLGDVPSQATDPRPIEYLSTISRPRESRDRYTLTSLHAKGGIGQVWLARDTELDREIALKELRPDRSSTAEAFRRFCQEARITGQLDHPGVVPVYELATGEAGQGEAHPYYTMRFVRGRTLSQAAADFHRKGVGEQGRRTELFALIQAFVGLCNTVAFAHSKGVIHRDLKGQNIILGDFGEVVLLDWGLAKLVDRAGASAEPEDRSDPTETVPYERPGVRGGTDATVAGQVLGTPAYMAPEQAEGRADRIGRATDVYGLGAILYEILAGRAPFDGTSTEDVLRKVREAPPTPPRQLCRSAPRALEAICLKALSKDPGARYVSASELAADVQHWLADEPVTAWREPWTVQARRWVGRNRTKVAAGVAALAVAVVALATLLTREARANRDLQEALERQKLAEEDAYEQSRQAGATIDQFYNGITEDVILRRPELNDLRRKLLGTAQEFYQRRVDYLRGPMHRTDDVQNARSAAAGLERIASLQALLGDREQAVKTRQKVLELYENTPGVAPEWIGDALLDLANLQRLMGRPGDALKSFRGALARYDRPAVKGVPQTKLGIVQADLGRFLVDVGRTEEGDAMLDRARAIQEGLVREDRTNRWHAGNLASTYTTLGNFREAELRQADAADLYAKAESIYAALADRYPGERFFQVELARARNNLGLAKAVAGKLEEGWRDVESGREIRARLSADQPLNIERRADLARSYYHLARVDALAGKPDAAEASIRKAEELYKDIPPKGPEDVYFRACMRALRAGLQGAGKPDAELSAPDRAERRRSCDEAMAFLKEAVRLGYSSPLRLKNDPPLEPLRSRPDFQELVRSIVPPEG